MTDTKVEEKEKPLPVHIVIRKDLTAMTEQFRTALPSHVPPERFVRIAVTAIATKPDLQSLDRVALYAQLMMCAQDGLLPDGREAAIVPYYDSKLRQKMPKYMPMVGGYCKRARQSGVLKTLDAHCVYEKDEYDAWTDETGEHFKFRKYRGPDDRGKPILSFAYAITTDGALYFEEIDEAQMLAIAKCSKADFGPWNSDFRDEMKRKSAIRRLCKYRLPSSTDLDELIRRDDDLYELPSGPTRESSALALNAAKMESDYLPGLKPPQTAAQFVEKLKDIPGGVDLIRAQARAYVDFGDVESSIKIFRAATLAGLSIPSPSVNPTDETSRSNETSRSGGDAIASDAAAPEVLKDDGDEPNKTFYQDEKRKGKSLY